MSAVPRQIARQITIGDLPAPPPGREGWPWTVGSLSVELSAKFQWPKISIITPSYNQGHFLERTLRSVLLQQYPDLEYIVIDGGSTDDSVSIITKYADFLAFWVSEPDQGQANALNKGLKHCTGDIIAFLNSDDYYLPDTLWRVAEQFSKHPDVPWLSGICLYYDEEREKAVTDRRFIRQLPVLPVERWRWPVDWPTNQPASFWRKICFEQVGGFREDLDLVFDTEFMVRLVVHDLKPLIVDEEFVVYTLHNDSKTVSRTDGYFWDAEQFRWDYLSTFTGAEQDTFYWYNLTRGYSVRLRSRGRLSALAFVLRKAVRHPRLFLRGLITLLRRKASHA